MSGRTTAAATAGGGGIGLRGLLTVVFVVFKLIGEHFHTPVADWSWWWVFVPLWGPLAVLLAGATACLLFRGIVLAGAYAIDGFRAARRRWRGGFGTARRRP